MSDEMYTFALKNTLNEIKKTCPTVKQAFIFSEDTETTVADDSMDAPTLRNAVNALKAIIQHAKATGGINTITFNNTNGKAHVAHIENLYVTTVTTKDTDSESANALTQALVTIILKILTKIPTLPISSQETPTNETATTTLETEFLQRPTAHQLLIDNLTGLLAPQDTVRIDDAIITQWKKLYPDKKIEQVEVETLNGKTTRCKAKPIKDQKQEGKGTIQIPPKIQQTLEAKKGDLVTVKPIIE